MEFPALRGGKEEALAAKKRFQIAKDNVLRVETPGG